MGSELNEKNAVRPDVRFDRELRVCDRFGRRPFHRKFGTYRSDNVIRKHQTTPQITTANLFTVSSVTNKQRHNDKHLQSVTTTILYYIIIENLFHHRHPYPSSGLTSRISGCFCFSFAQLTVIFLVLFSFIFSLRGAVR